jgi:hypothetical protein
MPRNIEINPKLNSVLTNDFPEIILSGLTTSYAIRLQVDDNGDVNYNGTYGTLFSVTDNKIGLLHSVNDISGLPILQVYSWDYVQMGTWNKYSLVVNGDKVGIGLTSPSNNFHIYATGPAFRLEDGTEQLGYVLTSDANGVGTWQAAGGITLNNNTNNNLVTMTGTASTLDGESDLQFDATNSTLFQNSNVSGNTLGSTPKYGISSFIDTQQMFNSDTGMWNGECITGQIDLTIKSGQTSVSFGQILYCTSDGINQAVWDLANAATQSAESKNLLGVCLTDLSSQTGTVDILLKGFICVTHSTIYNIAWNYGNAGNPLYLAAEDSSIGIEAWGAATFDLSNGFTASQSVVRVIGYFLGGSIGTSGSDFYPVIRFDPDGYQILY